MVIVNYKEKRKKLKFLVKKIKKIIKEKKYFLFFGKKKNLKKNCKRNNKK